MYQPDPPGLMHDDPRLLPPWRGSSLFWGKKSQRHGLSPSARALRRVHSVRRRSSPQIWHLCTLVSLSTDRGSGTGVWVDEARTVAAPYDGSSGVLAVLTDPQLRDELDRVAAAVGVRVVHAGAGSVGEQEDLVGGRGGGARRGGGGPVWAGGAAAARARQRAHRRRSRDGDVGWPRIAVGAQHVLRLPEQERELIRELGRSRRIGARRRPARRGRRRRRWLRRGRRLVVRRRPGLGRRRRAVGGPRSVGRRHRSAGGRRSRARPALAGPGASRAGG